MTLSYTSSPISGSDGNKVLLKNVSGRWEVSDHSVTLSNREVFYACVDPISQHKQSIIKRPSSNSFNYNTGFSHAVQESGQDTACGAHMSVDLRHGSSSSWTLEISNTLFNNMGLPDID